MMVVWRMTIQMYSNFSQTLEIGKFNTTANFVSLYIWNFQLHLHIKMFQRWKGYTEGFFLVEAYRGYMTIAHYLTIWEHKGAYLAIGAHRDKRTKLGVWIVPGHWCTEDHAGLYLTMGTYIGVFDHRSLQGWIVVHGANTYRGMYWAIKGYALPSFQGLDLGPDLYHFTSAAHGYLCFSITAIRIFLKLGNIVSKGLSRAEKKYIQPNNLPLVGIEPRTSWSSL